MTAITLTIGVGFMSVHRVDQDEDQLKESEIYEDKKHAEGDADGADADVLQPNCVLREGRELQ